MNRAAIIFLLFLSIAPPSSAQAPVRCNGKLTLEQIVGLIRGSVDESRIIQYIRECGVGFKWSADVAQSLRRENAPSSVIQLLEDNSAATAPANTVSEAELEYWRSIKDERDPSFFKAYLAKYPKGTFSDVATLKLRALENLSSNPSSPLPSSTPSSPLAVQKEPITGLGGVRGGDASSENKPIPTRLTLRPSPFIAIRNAKVRITEQDLTEMDSSGSLAYRILISDIKSITKRESTLNSSDLYINLGTPSSHFFIGETRQINELFDEIESAMIINSSKHGIAPDSEGVDASHKHGLWFCDGKITIHDDGIKYTSPTGHTFSIPRAGSTITLTPDSLQIKDARNKKYEFVIVDSEGKAAFQKCASLRTQLKHNWGRPEISTYGLVWK